jgi:hypothetical protein
MDALREVDDEPGGGGEVDVEPTFSKPGRSAFSDAC